MKYLGTRLVATTLAPKIAAESCGKFVTEGSSVLHGLGQVCRREEPFSYESCIIVRNSLYLKIKIFIYCI